MINDPIQYDQDFQQEKLKQKEIPKELFIKVSD